MSLVFALALLDLFSEFKRKIKTIHRIGSLRASKLFGLSNEAISFEFHTIRLRAVSTLI